MLYSTDRKTMRGEGKKRKGLESPKACAESSQ
jgi:hypothetical protein